MVAPGTGQVLGVAEVQSGFCRASGAVGALKLPHLVIAICVTGALVDLQGTPPLFQE